MSPPADSNQSAPVVHVLISDGFFWDKVQGTLRALEREPVTPDWEADVFEQVTAGTAGAAAGMVLDLEDERFETLPFLERIRQGAGTRELPILAYCSHQKHDLIRAAEDLGVEVVPRSTFAANLVRLLVELGSPPEEPGGAPQG